MNMQFLPGSNEASPDTSEDDVARKHYRQRIRKLEQRFGLPTSIGREYSSILKTCTKFGLITHLLFLYRRKKLSKKEYIKLSGLGNMSIISELGRKKLLSQLDL